MVVVENIFIGKQLEEQEQMAPWTKEAIGQITGVSYSVQRG
jgi:hypothetical protein